jgi:hypothetical protein
MFSFFGQYAIKDPSDSSEGTEELLQSWENTNAKKKKKCETELLTDGCEAF